MSDLTELTAEETALLEADRADKTPVEPTKPEPAPPVAPDKAAPAASPSDKPADAPTAPADPPLPEGEAHPQTVPYSALAEERNRRKESEKQARAAAEQMARLSGRLDQLNEILTPRQQAPAKPTVLEQPIEVLTDVERRLNQIEDQRQIEGQWAQFNAALQNATREFQQSTPDLMDAVAHLEANRIAELRALGYPEAQLPALIQQEAVAIASLAFQQGANPAERFYKAAEARGYRKAAPAPNGAAEASQRGPDGKFQASAAAQKLAIVAKGQETAGRSLSGAGGAAADGLTLEALASMSDEDFSTLKDSAWKKLWQ